jgi:hypothetical protein
MYFKLTENNDRSVPPKDFPVDLKPHQLAALKAMIELETNRAIIISDQNDITKFMAHTGITNLNLYNSDNNFEIKIGTSGGILADIPGAGKTYTLLALIKLLNNPPFWKKNIVIDASGGNCLKLKYNSFIVNKGLINLIVLPHKLVSQWCKSTELAQIPYKRFSTIHDFIKLFDVEYIKENEGGANIKFNFATKNLPVRCGNDIVIYGKRITKTNDKGKKEVFLEKKILNMKKLKKAISKNNIFILNSRKYVTFSIIFNNIRFGRIIMDEVDTIDLRSFNMVSNFTWFVTGTPNNIHRSKCDYVKHYWTGEFNSMIQYFQVKNENSFVQNSFKLPNPNVAIIKCKLHQVVQAIRNLDLIPPDVMALINAGNMKEAIIKLNCNVETEDDIIKVLTTKLETDLHNFIQEKKFEESRIPIREDQIKTLEQKIERCITKLEAIKEKIKAINDECCFICTEEFDKPTILKCCNSTFCFACLIECLKTCGGTCPYCKQLVNKNDYFIIEKTKGELKSNDTKIFKPMEGDVDFKNLQKESVLEHLLAYIKSKDKFPRLLIFSDFNATFDKIKSMLDSAHLVHNTLKGSSSRIARIIDEYNTGKINVLMLNSQNFGSGLNLQATTHLILFHRMTRDTESQVIARAQRFGRKAPLNIIYLINDNENNDVPFNNVEIVAKLSDYDTFQNNQNNNMEGANTNIIIDDDTDNIINYYDSESLDEINSDSDSDIDLGFKFTKKTIPRGKAQIIRPPQPAYDPIPRIDNYGRAFTGVITADDYIEGSTDDENYLHLF